MARHILTPDNPTEKGCEDYTLHGGPGTWVWITVGNISVKIKHDDEGVAVDMYARGIESLDTAYIGGTWALFDGAQGIIDEMGGDT